MNSSSFTVHVLNTGDYYILAFENNLELRDKLIVKTLKIYQDIDESVEHYNLEILVSFREKEYIKTIFDRILPAYNLIDRLRKPEEVIRRITSDIKHSIEFHKIKNYWSMVTKEKVANIDDNYEDMAISTDEQTTYASLDDKCEILPHDFTQSLIPISSKKIDVYNPIYMILFHNIYNISLIVHDSYQNIKNVCDEFQEFEIMESFKNDIDKIIIENLKVHFHKKSFETKDALKHKMSCFKTLYFEDEYFKTSQKNMSEKERIHEFFNENYIINNDQNHKINASELYKTVMNHLCIGYEDRALFKKRLAGYLIEVGLTRKRYSEGYFYWGIQPSSKKPDNVYDILNKRHRDIKDYIPSQNKN